MAATTKALALEALERLYVNVRPEYPYSVRDWEIVKSALEDCPEPATDEQIERSFDAYR